MRERASAMFKIIILTLFCAGLVAADSKKKLKYKDQKVRRQAEECAVDQFRCSNGRCIQEEWVCDSDGDCADDSDEAVPGCTKDCTGPHKIKCKNGECVPLEFRCDGDDDCGDETDEQGCAGFECSKGETHCGDGKCIEDAWLCDGQADCENGWDENPANCHKVTPAA